LPAKYSGRRKEGTSLGYILIFSTTGTCRGLHKNPIQTSFVTARKNNPAPDLVPRSPCLFRTQAWCAWLVDIIL